MHQRFVALGLFASVAATSTAVARSAVELDEPQGSEPTTAPETTAIATDTRDVTLHKPATGMRNRDRPWRLEAGIGLRFGSFLVNNVDTKDTVKQLHLDGGIRLLQHRVLLYGQYALHSMQLPLDESAASAGMPVVIGNGRGLVHRVGAHGRYSFARGGDRSGGIDVYADAGVGVQHIRWDAGGVWTRPDLALSLGLTGFGIGDENHGGTSIAFVMTLAPRNDVDGAGLACGGPCDHPTAPTGIDRAFMFDVTVNFGR